jgi:hypothetical protein
VVSGSEDADYVRVSRSGYGIPFDVRLVVLGRDLLIRLVRRR